MSAANAPLIAAPDIALPGSGPAVGAPINSVNDSRSAVGPSIANPNAIVTQGAAGVVPTSVAPASETAAVLATGNEPSNDSANAQPLESGIQHFISGMPDQGNATPSLAEIAVVLKAQQRPAVKAFNNDSIAELNAKGIQSGNLGAGESNTVAENASSSMPSANEPSSIGSDGTEIAQNQTPALPQSDQPAPQTGATAAQQRHVTADQNAPDASSARNAPAGQQESPASQSSENQQKLPQSASPLPLFLLVGVVGLAGGAIYLLRR